MFKNRENNVENSSKKENESQICLEKLIKLDCRDSNFLFKDQLRKYLFFKLNHAHDSISILPISLLALATTSRFTIPTPAPMCVQDNICLRSSGRIYSRTTSKDPSSKKPIDLTTSRHCLAKNHRVISLFYIDETSYHSQEEFTSLVREVFSDSVADRLLSMEPRSLDD